MSTFTAVFNDRSRGNCVQREVIVLADSMQDALDKVSKHFEDAEITFISKNGTKVIQ